MKTKDFIKILQEADPSGEAHIRMTGGIPQYVELKEGYWDGPYEYIDKDGNYITSINGMKVDIHCVEIYDFVETHLNIHDTNNWEYIKSKFKFELGGYVNVDQRNERSDSILKNAKEVYDEQYNFQKKYFDESEQRSIKYITKENWKYFQNKLVDDKTLKPNMHHYFTWKIYNGDGKEESSNIHNVEGVYKSNKFERVDNNEKKGYYEWKLKHIN